MSVLAKRTAEQLNLLREMDGAYESDFDRKWHTIGEMDLFVEQELIAEGEWPPPGIKWYYSDKSVCIAHGDCREILPLLPKVDLVLTDPPYGIKVDRIMSAKGGKQYGIAAAPNGFYESYGWDDSPPSPDLLKMVVGSASWSIIWGGNYFSLGPARCFLVWDKLNGEVKFADAEVAWTNIDKPVRLKRHMWNGMLREGGELRNGHPTQKPLDVMKWALGIAPDSGSVLDPFMGSGTTLRAAKDLGRSAIGIEIEEKYCEIAAKRMSQEVLEFEPA